MRRAPIRAATIVALTLVVPAIAQQERNGAGQRVLYEPSDGVTVVRDIRYAHYGSRELLLDLYLPAEQRSEPWRGTTIHAPHWPSDRALLAGAPDRGANES